MNNIEKEELIRISDMTNRLISKVNARISELEEIIENRIYGRPKSKETPGCQVPVSENIIDRIIQGMTVAEKGLDFLGDDLFTKLDNELRKL